MTKIELREYQSIQKELKQINEMIRELNSRIYSPRVPILTGLPGAANVLPGSAQERTATEVIELKAHYEDKIKELYQKRLRIERAIDEVENGEQRRLLRYRYISGNSWEKIAQRIPCSIRTVHRIHAEALKEISKVGTL